MALDFWQVLEAIGQQYPQLIPILSKPGVFDALSNAINDPLNWPPARVEAAVQQTEWYQNTNKSMREWELKKAVDPATVRQTMEKYRAFVEDAQSQLGIKLNGGGGSVESFFASDYFKFVEEAAAAGWSFEEIKYQLSMRGGFGSGGGEIETQTAAVKKLSDDYGVPYSDWASRIWGTQLARGTVDMKAVNGYFAQQAKSLFPGISELIDRGFTVRQVADPYLQIVQQELGINPDTVSLTDPMWSKAINTTDAKGQKISMSLSDWTRTVRTDPVYGYDRTPKARQEGANLAMMLGQKMGALG